jgi:hypothetical protein
MYQTTYHQYSYEEAKKYSAVWVTDDEDQPYTDYLESNELIMLEVPRHVMFTNMLPQAYRLYDQEVMLTVPMLNKVVPLVRRFGQTKLSEEFTEVSNLVGLPVDNFISSHVPLSIMVTYVSILVHHHGIHQRMPQVMSMGIVPDYVSDDSIKWLKGYHRYTSMIENILAHKKKLALKGVIIPHSFSDQKHLTNDGWY